MEYKLQENKMTIRTATEKDIEELLVLINVDLGEGNVQKDFILNQLKNIDKKREEVFVADVDGKTAGFIHVEVYSCLYFGPVGNILGLSVRETYRRKGFATELLRSAEDWSKTKGCIGMRLNSGGTRLGAHEFYRSQGYDNEKSQIRFLKMYKE